MSRPIKLLILVILSLSVFYIYKIANSTTYNLLVLGDNLSQGINSYGIKDYGYIDYYRDYLLINNKRVNVNDNYSSKELSISNLLELIKYNPTIKRDLTEAHQLILNVGYNDLLYQLNVLERINDSQVNLVINNINHTYNNLLNEIKKYYKNEIIVIGYFSPNKNDYYLNKGVRSLNNYLSKQDNIVFIDTYNLLNNRNLYFSNPNSYYPNLVGYKRIADKIIVKTLEK